MVTPNSVAELARSDLPVLLTLAEEVADRDRRESWTTVHEVLAQVHDLLQVMRVEHLMGLGVKSASLPKPVRMPRPGEEPPPDAGPRTVSARELAMMTTRGG